MSYRPNPLAGKDITCRVQGEQCHITGLAHLQTLSTHSTCQSKVRWHKAKLCCSFLLKNWSKRGLVLKYKHIIYSLGAVERVRPLHTGRGLMLWAGRLRWRFQLWKGCKISGLLNTCFLSVSCMEPFYFILFIFFFQLFSYILKGVFQLFCCEAVTVCGLQHLTWLHNIRMGVSR